MSRITRVNRMSPRTAAMHLTSTGVRIGICTVPVQRFNSSADTDRLQALLLFKARRVDAHSTVALVSVLLGLAVSCMAFIGWLPGGGA